ncbi:sialidase-like [Ixodes scapularis]
MASRPTDAGLLTKLERSASANYTPIADLNNCIAKVTVIGIVITKQSPRTISPNSEKPDERCVLNFTLRDSQRDTVNAACWGDRDSVTNIGSGFRIGDCVQVNALVRNRNLGSNSERFSPDATRSYAAVAHPAGASRPHQPSQGAAGKSPPVSEELSDNLDPSIRLRDRPLAPSDTPSGDSSSAFSSVTSTAVKSPDVFSMETPVQAIVKAQVTAATPPTAPAQVTAATPPTAPAQVTAATPTIAPAQAAGAALPVVPTQDDAAASPDGLDFQESDVADSSHSPGRLVISDDTDLTPGQREPSARSELSPSTQRESSKFSSSDEGEDRGDAKRTFPSTSSGSDGPIASTVKKKRSEPHDSDEDYSLTF